MGLRPTEGDEKRLPLSSRPKRSEVEGPAVRPGPTQLFANPLRFVISTGESHLDRIVIYGKRAALHVFRPERTRISCHAALTNGSVCGFH